MREAINRREDSDHAKKWIDWQLDKFFELSLLLPRENNSEGKYYGGCRYFWDSLASHWLDEPVEEASQDIIVRVASDIAIQDALWNISKSPSTHLLSRRELVEVGKAKELDPVCLRWLAKRPGPTFYDKALSSGKILARNKIESFDSLENRIFDYVLTQLIERAKAYLTNNSLYYQGERYCSVERLLRKMLRLREKALYVLKYPLKPSLSLAPNNILLYDSNYSAIWSLYRQLLMIDQIRENANCWQRSLWKETASQIVGALLSSTKSPYQPLARSCVYIKSDMHQGVWTEESSPPGPFSSGATSFTIFSAGEKNLPERYRTVLHALQADQLIVYSKNRSAIRYIALSFHHDPFEEVSDREALIRQHEGFHLSCSEIHNIDCCRLIVSSALANEKLFCKCIESPNPMAFLLLPIAPLPPQNALSELFFDTLSWLMEEG